MAPRTSWKGFLKLSLVSVPVKAYTANNTTEEVHLNQLHKDCNSRVRYQKVCPEHGVLKSEDIVSGYEYAKDEYVIIEGDELAKIRKQSDRAISILGFVDPEQIDPVYFAGRAYYLAPDGVVGTRPFALLHKGMSDGNLCALAQIVIAGREQLVMVQPEGALLTMVVLNHEKKVKPIAEFTELIEDGDLNLTADEVSLANTLIQASTLRDFEFGNYKDEYVGEMKRLIKMKVEGQEVVSVPDREEPKIINLMDALKQSVAAAQAAQQQQEHIGERKMTGSEGKSSRGGKSSKKASPSGRREAAPRRRKKAE